MDKEIDIILNKMNLKKNLIIETNKKYEDLQSKKDTMPKEIFKKQIKEIEKEFKRKLKKIDKSKQ